MKHPTAQELINNCKMGDWEFVEWYNFSLKYLNYNNKEVKQNGKRLK